MDGQRSHHTPAIPAFAIMCLLAALLNGCTLGQGASGTLRAVSLNNDPVELPATFAAATYFSDPLTGTSFMLSSVDPEQLMKGDIANAQILHIELLWRPKAGMTPMDHTATNASIRYIIVSDDEVGIYGGAGFAWPTGDFDGNTIRISLEDASLQLLESTAGFRDVLSPAQLTGSFNANRDERTTRQLNYAASQLVTNALGRTRFVRYLAPNTLVAGSR